MILTYFVTGSLLLRPILCKQRANRIRALYGLLSPAPVAPSAAAPGEKPPELPGIPRSSADPPGSRRVLPHRTPWPAVPFRQENVVGKASDIRSQLAQYGTWREKRITDPDF
jgi:hypothetical protein